MFISKLGGSEEITVSLLRKPKIHELPYVLEIKTRASPYEF